MVATKKKAFVKKTLYLLSIFILGAVHFIIAQNTIKPTKRQLNLALVHNEFLDKPPTKIVVLGQLNSGNEYAADILREAFGTDMVILHEHIYRNDFLDQSEISDVASRTDILWVMTMKSPCEWADSVMQIQKSACERKELSGEQCKVYEFASDTDYYRIPWYDFDWHQNSNTTIVNGKEENNVIIRSKSEHNPRYDDIFDARQRKLLLMKQIMDAVPRHVKILRLGEFQLNPDVFVKDLVKEYQFKLSNKYKPASPQSIDPQEGSNTQNTFSCMEYSKWIEAQQRIDWTLEGYFGHNHLDCHLCHGDNNYGQASSIGTPKNIYVLGERNSGTTFVSNTLAEAFDPPNTMGSHLEKFSSDIPVLLHKHMFRHDLLNKSELAEIKSRDDILWVMVVRSPCDWAEGMFRKPYHLCPPKHPEKCGPESNPNDKVWMNQNTVAGVPLLHFFTEMKWNDWAESVPFLRDTGGDGKRKTGVEVSISKVSANYTYPNVFGLRRHKLGIMKQILEVAPRNVKLVRLKELERSPELFIQSIVKEFNLTVKDDYKPQPQSVVAHPTTCLTKEEWNAAQRNIDWNVEAEFGFSPFDCRMCYGYERSTRLYTRVVESRKVNKLLKEQGQDVKQNGKASKTRGGKNKEELSWQGDHNGNSSNASAEERKRF